MLIYTHSSIWPATRPHHLLNFASEKIGPRAIKFAYNQSWALATSQVAALLLLGKKGSAAAAYRYSNEKVAPLPLVAAAALNRRKTMAF